MSLNLYGPINDLGYGIVTRGIIKGLIELGITNFHLDLIGPPHLDNQEELKKLGHFIKNNLWARNFPGVCVWHEFDLSKFSGKKLIAMPIFETTDFFPVAKSYLSQMDAVFVLSTWAKEVIHSTVSKDLPVFVVPAAANLIEESSVISMEKSPVFTFLSVGKFEKRKGHVELLQAYINAFKDNKAETRLRLHCYNPFDQNFSQTMGRLFQSLGLNIINSVYKNVSLTGICGNAIVEVPLGRISEIQLAQLYRSAHMGVYPARAEGWNLPLMESIQHGIPCIASNYSAHTEYLNESYRYPADLLLNNGKMEVANDGMFFHGDRGYWKAPDINELSEKLLYAYNNYSTIINTFDNTLLKNTFTWKNTASKLLENISKI